jgi:hypothetical protein
MARLEHRGRPVVITLYEPEGDPEFKKFLDGQTSKRTRYTYLSYLRKLYEFDSTVSGAEMLRNSKAWVHRILELHGWLINTKKHSSCYAESMCGMIRGFFASNRKALALIPQERRKLGRRRRVTEDFYFNRETLKRLWDVASLKEKWCLINKSFGLRAEDYSKLTFGDLRTIDLTLEPPIFFKEFATEKEGIKAFLFIDSDCVPVIKNILEISKDKPNDAEVFTSQSDELSYVLQSLARKANLEVGNQRIRFHCLPKVPV